MRLSRMAFMGAALVLLSHSIEAGEPRWRYGVGVATQNIVCGEGTVRLSTIPGYRPGDAPFNPMGIGWHFNWSRNEGPSVPGVEFMPLVGGYRPGVNPSIATIASASADYPDGTTFLIGNEIVWDDQRTPRQYAEDYHAFYYGLKSINPTWKVANGSIITSVNYNRPQWSGTCWALFDAIWDEYRDLYGEDWPVDVWNIHPYVWTLPTAAEELANFEGQLLQTRAWMKQKGQQDKPLIITEYGLLNYHTWDRMIEFLYGSFRILETPGHPDGMPSDGGRLVQRWAWFVMNDHVWECDGPRQWPHTCLYDPVDWTLTPLGRAFMEWTSGFTSADGWLLYR